MGNAAFKHVPPMMPHSIYNNIYIYELHISSHSMIAQKGKTMQKVEFASWRDVPKRIHTYSCVSTNGNAA